jgi:hypothetical protein
VTQEIQEVKLVQIDVPIYELVALITKLMMASIPALMIFCTVVIAGIGLGKFVLHMFVALCT